MAIMYPKNISLYTPVESERIVYYELKKQLPDSFEVFYSVPWTSSKNGKLMKSESDFIIVSPDYGFLCLEVKGGSKIRKENELWYVKDKKHGERRLNISPYDQADKSMYYFENLFLKRYNIRYPGIYGSGVIFPFYAIPEDLNLDNRQRDCTIDCNDLNHLYEKIRKMYRLWAGTTYGTRVYNLSQHDAFIELIRDRIAIEAAAGALVRFKEQELQIINRVQDNYVYLLKNIKRFYIKGGAGTGKTWIAKKMAILEAKNPMKKVMFLCASPMLSQNIKKNMPKNVDVYYFKELLTILTDQVNNYVSPMYEGISESINVYPHYDALFIDEAQDFNEEWAQITNQLLRDDDSRLGVFYDDVQILRKNSFGDAFDIIGAPYLLRENIRNTSNIYTWVAEQTNLGKDVIVNPIEGPSPVVEYILDHHHLTHRIEILLKKYLVDEQLSNEGFVIITDHLNDFLFEFAEGIAKWKFVNNYPCVEDEIYVASIEEFKGLEANMVIYIHSTDATNNMNYIAYTRAKYYLIELIRRDK